MPVGPPGSGNVTETAALGALGGMVKPADLGAFEPLESAAAADPTFAAIVDSFGQAPALSLAPVQARPTASLGRNAAEIGNLLPLPYRNGVLGEPVATPAAALSANVPGPLPSAPGVSAPLADPFPRHSAAPVTARQPGTFVTQRSNREPSGGEWLTRPTAEEGLPESDGLRRIFGREPIPAALETDRFVTAQNAGNNAIGAILTGMGDDGARGLKEMHEAGAKTFAQDAKTSVVWGMPGEAVKHEAVDTVLPLDRVSPEILAVV